jgi:hypothetical protein
MKAYRLKHKPTGLFYQPSRGNGNLSKFGKPYVSTKPKIEWALCLRIRFYSVKSEPKGHHKIICDHFNIPFKNGFVDTYVKTQPEDWEIIEI